MPINPGSANRFYQEDAFETLNALTHSRQSLNVGNPALIWHRAYWRPEHLSDESKWKLSVCEDMLSVVRSFRNQCHELGASIKSFKVFPRSGSILIFLQELDSRNLNISDVSILDSLSLSAYVGDTKISVACDRSDEYLSFKLVLDFSRQSSASISNFSMTSLRDSLNEIEETIVDRFGKYDLDKNLANKKCRELSENISKALPGLYSLFLGREIFTEWMAAERVFADFIGFSLGVKVCTNNSTDETERRTPRANVRHAHNELGIDSRQKAGENVEKHSPSVPPSDGKDVKDASRIGEEWKKPTLPLNRGLNLPVSGGNTLIPNPRIERDAERSGFHLRRLDRTKASTVASNVMPAARFESQPELQAELMDALWPIIVSLNPYLARIQRNRGQKYEIETEDREFTASFISNRRMLYITSLGAGMTETSPVYSVPLSYLLISPHRSTWQIGRTVDKIHRLGLYRLASLYQYKEIHKANDRMRQLIEDLDAGAYVDDISADLRDSWNSPRDGLVYRVEWSIYYARMFKSLLRSLEFSKIEGYQTYPQFVARRLLDKFNVIESVSRRYAYLNSKLSQGGIELSTALTRDLLRFAERVSVFPLAYYSHYALKYLNEYLSHDHNIGVLKDWASIWFGLVLFYGFYVFIINWFIRDILDINIWESVPVLRRWQHFKSVLRRRRRRRLNAALIRRRHKQPPKQ